MEAAVETPGGGTAALVLSGGPVGPPEQLTAVGKDREAEDASEAIPVPMSFQFSYPRTVAIDTVTAECARFQAAIPSENLDFSHSSLLFSEDFASLARLNIRGMVFQNHLVAAYDRRVRVLERELEDARAAPKPRLEETEAALNLAIERSKVHLIENSLKEKKGRVEELRACLEREASAVIALRGEVRKAESEAREREALILRDAQRRAEEELEPFRSFVERASLYLADRPAARELQDRLERTLGELACLEVVDEEGRASEYMNTLLRREAEI